MIDEMNLVAYDPYMQVRSGLEALEARKRPVEALSAASTREADLRLVL